MAKKRLSKSPENINGVETSALELLSAVLALIATQALRAGVSSYEFLRVARAQYAKAAFAEIDATGKRPTVSRIAAATGLHRKEIKELLEQTPVYGDAGERVTKRLTPVARVVHRWLTDPAYLTPQRRPRDLELSSKPRSFFQLVKDCAPDLPYVSVLRELERQGLIGYVASSRVKLRLAKALPAMSSSQFREFLERTNDFSWSLSRGLSADGQNLFSAASVIQGLDGAQAQLFLRQFTNRASNLLESVERWKRLNLVQARSTANQSAYGLGVYLFERPMRSRTQKLTITPKVGVPTRAKKPRAIVAA